MYDLKKAKRQLLLLKLLFTLFSLAIPIGFVTYKYEFFTEFNGYKAGFTAFIFTLLLLWKYKKEVGRWLNDRKTFSLFRSVIYGFSKVWVFPLIWVVALMIKMEAENLMFIIQWVTASECIAFMVLQPIIEKITKQIEREERKKEMREAMLEVGEVTIR